MTYLDVTGLIVELQHLFLLMLYVNLVEMVRKHLKTEHNVLTFILNKLVDQEKEYWMMEIAYPASTTPSCHQTKDDVFHQIVVNTNTHLKMVIVLIVGSMNDLHRMVGVAYKDHSRK